MPIALIIAAIQAVTTYVLINMGLSQLHALVIVLGFSAIFLLIIFIILVLAVRDDAKLYMLFKTEMNSCIKELKGFWKKLTSGDKRG